MDKRDTVCLYSISCRGGLVRDELKEHVMLERVEMIARLATETRCQERDREIALGLIAEIAKGNTMKSNGFTVIFSASVAGDRLDGGCS